MGRVSKLPDQHKKIRFEDLKTREHVHLRVEYSESGYTIYPRPEEVPEGSIVKITIKYPDGDQERADKVLTSVRDVLEDRVYYIRPPEKIVVRDMATRECEISSSTPPLKAIKMWMENKPPVDMNPIDMLAIVRKYLAKVDIPDRLTASDMTISQIGLVDFMPFKGHQCISNIPNGLIGVLGEYSGQSGRSNRSGKSALLDAVLYALHGTSRQIGDRKSRSLMEMIHKGSDSMSTSLVLSADGRLHYINRVYKLLGKSGVSSAKIDGNNLGIDASKEVVKSLFGMDRDDFLRTCFVRQGDLENILSRTGSQLRDDISKWKGLDLWPKLEEMAKMETASWHRSLEVARIKFDATQEVIKRGRTDDNEIKSCQDRLREDQEHNARIAVAQKRLKELRLSYYVAESIEGIVDRRDEIPVLEKTITKCQKELKKVEILKSDANVELRSAEKETREREKQVQKGFDGICPIDGVQCPRINDINSDCEEVQSRLIKVKEIEKSKTSYFMKCEKDYDDKKSDFDSVENDFRQVVADKKRLDDYKGSSTDEIDAVIIDIEKDNEIGVIDTTETEKILRDMQIQASKYDVAFDEEKKHNTRMEECENEIRHSRYVKFMCSKYGIPSMMIAEALDEIAIRVNLILEDLGVDPRLMFEHERELRTRAKVCYKCGYIFSQLSKEKICTDCGELRGMDKSDELRPMVVEGDRIQHFDLDSGAGRGLIALATRVSMAIFLGSKILFLDEVTGMLDEYHLGTMIKFLHNLTEMGFNQIFVISHNKEIIESAPFQIRILRYQEEDRSEIK